MRQASVEAANTAVDLIALLLRSDGRGGRRMLGDVLQWQFRPAAILLPQRLDLEHGDVAIDIEVVEFGVDGRPDGQPSLSDVVLAAEQLQTTTSNTVALDQRVELNGFAGTGSTHREKRRATAMG